MKYLIELDEEYVRAIDKIKFLVGGRTDRKLQLEIIKAIKNGKALEQEPREGHWVIKDNMWWVCSACGCQTRMMKKYNVPNFCPGCGAKMEEVRNERNEYGRYAKNYQ